FSPPCCTALADLLNRAVLPPGYIALEQVHAGAPVEIGTSATAPLLLPTVFPDGFTVEIRATEGGRSLVAAIELASPGNKDRAIQRRLFAAKCATYLARGVGLIVVDIVTSRPGNLHNELVNLLGLDAAFQMPASLYTVAYRPVRRDGRDQFESWPLPLVLGQPLPTVPLSLEAGLCVPLDLEAAYLDACQRRRLDEVTGAG